MENHETYDDILKGYFKHEAKEDTIKKAMAIRNIQKAVQKLNYSSLPLWGFISKVLDEAKIGCRQLPKIAHISNREVDALIDNRERNPFAIEPSSMACILLTFSITTKMFQEILVNSLIAKKAASQVQQTAARSNTLLPKNVNAKSIQNSIDSLLIQMSKEQSESQDASKLTLDYSEMRRIEVYLSLTIDSLKKIDAEYLIT